MLALLYANLPRFALWAGVALVYWLTAQLGLLLTSVKGLASPVWPPTGLALGAVLLLGYRIWPGLAVGSILAGLTALASLKGQPFTWLAGGVSIGVGNLMEALSGAWLVNRFAQGRAAFQHPRSVLLFVGLAAAGATVLSATAGAATAVWTGLARGQNLGSLWFTWWLGDLVSAILIAPLILVWGTEGWPRGQTRRLGELAGLGLLLVLVCGLVFYGWPAVETRGVPLSFLVLPVLLWAALRFGQRGTTTVAFLVAGAAILATLQGLGPFAGPNRNLSLLLLQNFVAVISVLSLILAANVAQRQSVENHLRASEHRYRALFENNPLPMWVYDCDTLRLLAVNQAAIEHYGYTREEFLAMQITDLRPPEDVDRLRATLGQVSEGLSHSGQWRHRKKNGALIDVEIIRHSLAFDGRRAALVLSSDITQRLRVETALHESDERLRLALAASKMGTWMLEWGQTPRLLLSPELEGIFGLQPGEFKGTREALLELVHPEDRETIRKTSARVAQARTDCELEFRFLPRGGTVGWMLLRGRAYHDDQGRPGRLIGVGIDITARKQAEQEVLRLNAELERRVGERTAQLQAINKELEAFSYSVSHDLRAPLRSIRGFSEVLLERHAEGLDARGQEFLRRVCESSQHMDKLIADLLKLSRVGRSELQCQAVDLSALAHAIVAELRQAEPSRAVEVIIQPGLRAWGDERLLRIVLDNFLRNAFKFTAKQPLARIEFGRTAEAPPAFFVRDNGAGFDMAYAGKLFGVFQRLHSTSEFPGTGVGLATVQRIINRHGGRVWAVGALNQGATFCFTLPASGDF